MKKLSSARAAVLASPLQISAAQLLTFAEKGTVQSWSGGDNGAFSLTYTAHLIVTGYTGVAHDLFFVVATWLQGECPGAPDDALKFHVDVIDHKCVDVSLAVEITEIIAAISSPAGLRLQSVDDPDVADLDMAAFFPDLPAQG